MKKLASVLAAASIFLITFSFSTSCSAQVSPPESRIAKKIAELNQQGRFEKLTSVFSTPAQGVTDRDISSIIKKYTLLDVHDISEILRNKPAYLRFNVPVENGARQLRISLYKENISPNGFTLLTDKGIIQAETQDIVHYRGSINDDLSSVAAFTFAGNEVLGFINNSEGNYVIGKTGTVAGKHIIYNDKDLLAQTPFECGTNTLIPGSPVTLARPGEAVAVATKCINWYWETDYDLFVNKGSVADVNAYMQGLFNQMATLYANDGMTMTLKTLFVWSTSDPYTGTTTSNYLDQFGAYRTSFDGDLAHLIGLKGGGGIAWINGLCKSTNYRMAYSGINSTYSNVPTFSWSVECVTHEQGHLLGSRHTHDCAWNGNNTKIDGCGDAAGYPSGSCAAAAVPAGGGTIMSYCHLTSAGINFNLGFGPQPTALMISTINAASCLVACGSCTVPSQPGAITGSNAVCSGTSQTYSVTAVGGATSYTWSLPSGWSGSSTTNSITVTAGSAGGTISVTANNSCGNSTAGTLIVTASSVPAQPGTVSGNTSVCAGTSQTYSVTAVAGATSYTWTLPAGWTGTSSTNTINVTTGSAGGTLSIKANNSCGSGVARTAALTITSAAPAQPASITGNSNVCAGSSQVYSIAAVAGATSYTWVLPSGWSGSSTTNSISVTAGSAGGNISVSANNGCGTSAARTLTVSVSALPATPGAITVSGGSAAVCTGDTRTYSTPLVSGVTYNWVAPSGSTITGGQGSNSIQLSFSSGFISGSALTVNAVNACGSSTSPASIIISKNSISAPGSITVSGGSAKVCPGDVRTYSVSSIAGITYNWTAPTGASITGVQGTGSITISYTSGFTAAGSLNVTANNNCGTSSASTLAINRNILPKPGRITGGINICPNAVRTYSITAVAGATSYVWTVPAGATIQGASTGTSIQVQWGSAGGNVTVKAVNSCGNSVAKSKAVAINCTGGISNVFVMKAATVYPNPARDRITVEFTSADHAACTIYINDIVGRNMVTAAKVAEAGTNLFSFNVSKFSKGAYIISIRGKAGTQSLKLNLE